MFDKSSGRDSSGRSRKQKHDRRDSDWLLSRPVEERFPAIWLPTKEQLDQRALLRHRHQWVRLRTKMQKCAASFGPRPAARFLFVDASRPTGDGVFALVTACCLSAE